MVAFLSPATFFYTHCAYHCASHPQRNSSVQKRLLTPALFFKGFHGLLIFMDMRRATCFLFDAQALHHIRHAANGVSNAIVTFKPVDGILQFGDIITGKTGYKLLLFLSIQAGLGSFEGYSAKAGNPFVR